MLLAVTGCAQGKLDRTGISAFFDRLFHRQPPPPAAAVHYTVGAAYPAGGIWYYPREDFGYDMTGIAAIQTGPHEALTSDGEVYDPAAMAAAHPTLQLPAVLRVTNLANGRQVLLRLNDRGPANPGRILAVTPRAGQLLGFDADGTAPVRVQIEQAPSQALATELHGGEIAVAAAPVTGVQATNLPPPPGARVSNRAYRAAAAPATVVADTTTESVPLRLPETVLQVAPAPGTIWIEAGRFGAPAYARIRAAQLADTGAQVGRLTSGGQTSYTVRIGPLGSVAQADAALAAVISAGVRDATIAVE